MFHELNRQSLGQFLMSDEYDKVFSSKKELINM